MKTPLIVKGSKLSGQPPKVFLLDGMWVIRSDHKDGTIFLDSDDGPLPIINEMKIPGNRFVQVRFDSCMERAITILAERV